MAAVKVIFLFALVAGILATKDPNGHCQLKAKGESKKVCNGAIGKDMGKFVKICLNGILKIKKKASVEPAAPQCENEEGEVFCEGDVVEEKTCNQQENYMKKCENGTLGWKKESVSGSPLKESCDPCPSCELEGNLYCDTEVVQEKSCGEDSDGYEKTCVEGLLVWKSSPESSLPPPSSHCSSSPDPCPSCHLDGVSFCETEVAMQKSCGEDNESKYTRTCQNGELSWQTDSASGPSTGTCEWYGAPFCDQEVIEDLYRWWFLQKCSKGKMNLLGRPWNEVVADPRYKALQGNRVDGG